LVTLDLTPPEAAQARGQRLDKYLAARAAEADSPLSGYTRTRLQKLIDDGHVSVDGKSPRASLKLTGAERLLVTLPPPEPLALVPEALPLDILYEDGDLIVIAKSSDMIVHPGAGRKTGTLVNALLAHCRDLSGIGGVTRPGIVHRLDRGTSGALVVAKNDHAHESLAGQFARREVEKRYTALVFGTPVPAQGRISTLYGRHSTHRLKFTTKVTSGKKALTDYRVVRSAGGVSELDVLLGTGRTHQIRVHLSERGHPVLGDALYGGRVYGRISDPALKDAAQRLTHQALHARVLAFRQPTTGKWLELEAPLPADLMAITAPLTVLTKETTGQRKNR
jgi:23S rRNA pseudouridine1911/1915/1917 synthase